ncbi:hypothetical protein C8A00DRAFT_17896 [Chaetomidium leptoderma]|uniref:Uncharacterized protein n=1 Tax=Chaetomidium leptoderma TaxID=669021 RepID=A0AAN6VGF0_9PEZI|nr:hypothetical protein C8A00DRAFT_17896 [Chaetomidium leptoderma]
MKARPQNPPPPPWGQLTQTTPILDAVLRAVYASDQAMYPVALSYPRLRAWVDACPELSISFRISGRRPAVGPPPPLPAGEDDCAAVAAGVVMVLPLRRSHWEDLLAGRLKEPEIEPGRMFPGEREVEEVGLHVYHIERFEAQTGSESTGGGIAKKGFAEFALDEVVRRMQSRLEWRVIGMSALTATSAGKRTFERLGFTPTGYRELFVVKVAIGVDGAGDDSSQKMDMICVYPGDEGRPDKCLSGGVVAAMSEMAVKYNLSQPFNSGSS